MRTVNIGPFRSFSQPLGPIFLVLLKMFNVFLFLDWLA